jgi:uncharacterized protein (DUF1778 family)
MTITRGKKSVIVGMRVDEDVYRVLVRAAAQERRAISSFTRNIILEYLAYVARQSRRSAAREQRESAPAEIGAQA